MIAMKLAVWRTGYGSATTLEWTNDGVNEYLQKEGWVRVSEPVEVEFTERAQDVVLGEQLEALDKKEEALREELAKKVDEIQKARDALRQITFNNPEAP